MIDYEDVSAGWYLVEVRDYQEPVVINDVTFLLHHDTKLTIIHVRGIYPFLDLFSPLDSIQEVCDNEKDRIKFLERINFSRDGLLLEQTSKEKVLELTG